MKSAEIKVGQFYVNAKGQARLVADEAPAWLRNRGFGIDDHIHWIAYHGGPGTTAGTPVMRRGQLVSGVTTRRGFATWAKSAWADAGRNHKR